MSSDECEILQKTKNRNFRCACGKAYLSYAALFTHIKLKHGGLAPGPISKPSSVKSKRGRPPINSTKKVIESEDSSMEIIKEMSEKNEISKLHELSQRYFWSSRDEMKIYEQINQYKYLINLLDDPFEKRLKKNGYPNIKNCLQEFFAEIKGIIKKQAYEELIILFSLMIEFLADEYNDPEVINNGFMETMINKANEFMIDGYQWLIHRATLTHLWVFQYDNMVKIFEIFFKWSENKGYSPYEVKLKPELC